MESERSVLPRRASFVKSGAAAIFLAKLVFMASGYALVFGLTRLLSPADFGRYSVVNAAISLVNMVLISGTMQTVSRHVARTGDGSFAVRRRIYGYQAVFAGGVTLLLFAFSFALPELLNEPAAGSLFRIGLVISGFYAFYAINVGFLNGEKLFLRQASLDMSFTSTKVALMVAAAYLGFGLEGVFIGFGAAALLILIVSFGVLPRAEVAAHDAPELGFREFSSFTVSVMGAALLLNGVLQTDLFLLKSLSPEGAEGSELAGLYAAAQQISRIPYYLMVTVGLVMFPSIAALSGTAPEQKRQRGELAARVLHGAFNLILGMTAIAVPLSGPILRLLFPPAYEAAAVSLSVLLCGLAVLTLLYLATTVFTGAGNPRLSLLVLLGTLLLQVIAGRALIPSFGIVGAAIATLAACSIALTVAVGVLVRDYEVPIRWRYLGTGAVTSAIVGACAYGFSWLSDAAPGKLATLLFLGAAFGLFVLLSVFAGTLVGPAPSTRPILWVSKALNAPMNDGSKVLVASLAERVGSTVPLVVLSSKGARCAVSGAPAVPIYGRSGFAERRTVQNLRVFLYLLLFRRHYRALHFFFAPNLFSSGAAWILRLISPGLVFFQSVLSRPKDLESKGLLYFGHATFVSSRTTQEALSRLGLRGVHVARPCVPPEHFRSPLAPPRGGPGARLGLLFAGDIEHGGALPHLASLVPRLLAADDGISFVFSVRIKGPDTRAVAQRFFDEHLSRFGTRAQMCVDHDHFSELLDGQDAMLLPVDDLHRKIDLPLVALETLARGKPVFCFDRPPLHELYAPEDRRRYCAEDVPALEARILEFKREVGAETGRHLAAWARESFDVTATSETILRAYREHGVA